MTLHQKIGLSVFGLVALVVVGSAYIYLRYQGISASEMEERGKVSRQIKLTEDLNGDGRKEEVLATSYVKDEKYRSFISSRDRLMRFRERELVGFEEDLAFCPYAKVITVEGEAAICIFGEVGVHSQNIQIVRWRELEAIKFISKEGTQTPNLNSDMPNFDFNHLDSNQLILHVDNRDYDKDPLVDIIRTSYYVSNNAFKFLGEESLSMEGVIK